MECYGDYATINKNGFPDVPGHHDNFPHPLEHIEGTHAELPQDEDTVALDAIVNAWEELDGYPDG